MKQNNKPTTYNGNKKLILLLALLLCAGVAKGAAEEIIGKIMSPPEKSKSWTTYSFYYNYFLDTNGDNIVDKTMTISEKINGEELYDILPKYLDKDWKVVYEDKDVKGKKEFGAQRLIAIISPGDNTSNSRNCSRQAQ